MLRHLYKTLIISIMCGSLSIMDMAAFAQTRENNAPASTPKSTSTMSAATPTTPVTRDANGVYKKTENYHFEGTKGKDDNILHSITMFAVAFIGVKLLFYKKWTMDMTMVAAGAAAYIAAEIVNIMNLKKQISDMEVSVTKSSDGKIDQTQIETLEKLKKSYQAVQKSLETRKMLQKAAAAVFAGAALVAAYQRWSEDGKFASCEAGITSALTALTTAKATAASTPATASTVPEFEACIAQITLLQTEITKYKTACEAAKSKSILSFMATNPDYVASSGTVVQPCIGTGAAASIKATFVTPSCSTYLTEAAFNKAYGQNEVVNITNFSRVLENKVASASVNKNFNKEATIIPPKSLSKFLESSVGILFPKAEAGTMSMLGLAGGAVTALVVAYKGTSQTIDTWMYTPGARIIAWGIFTAAAMAGASASQKEIDKIKDRISDIDRILNDMYKLQAGIKANNVQEQQIRMAAFQNNQSSDLALSSNAAVKTDCLTSNSNNGCAPLEGQLAAMPGFANLPDSFKSIASQAARLGDGLSSTGTISGSTLTTAGNLANNANAISKMLNKMKSKINDDLSKSGKAKVDYEKEESKLLGQLKKDTLKGIESKGFSPASFMSSVGISEISANAKPSLADKSSDKKTGLGTAAVAGPQGSKKDKSFDLDFKEAGGDLALEGVAGAGAAGSGAEEKYDIGQNDINTNSNESIFEMISNRYIKSGYPKLLEEEAVKK